MSGIGMTIKLIGAEKLIKSLIKQATIKEPIDKELRKLAVSAKGKLIKATVVGLKPKGTGFARANIERTPIQYAQFQAIVTHDSGPGSSYIPFLETGTSKMEARHMEGRTTKVLGEGMFSYVKRWLAGKVADAAKHIAKDIEGKF